MPAELKPRANVVRRPALDICNRDLMPVSIPATGVVDVAACTLPPGAAIITIIHTATTEKRLPAPFRTGWQRFHGRSGATLGVPAMELHAPRSNFRYRWRRAPSQRISGAGRAGFNPVQKSDSGLIARYRTRGCNAVVWISDGRTAPHHTHAAMSAQLGKPRAA